MPNDVEKTAGGCDKCDYPSGDGCFCYEGHCRGEVERAMAGQKGAYRTCPQCLRVLPVSMDCGCQQAVIHPAEIAALTRHERVRFGLLPLPNRLLDHAAIIRNDWPDVADLMVQASREITRLEMEAIRG